MGKCCICHKEIDTETAPILYMGATGIPRCVCDECDKSIEQMTKGRESEAVTEACRTIARRLEEADNEDERTILLIGGMLEKAKARAAKIDAGELDFEAEEDAESEEDFEITEELMETDEDRALDERDERIGKIIDTVTTWIMGLAIVGAIAFFILKFVFHVI